MYVDRGNTGSFDFITTVFQMSSNSTVSMLNLAEGQNTVRIKSTQRVWTLKNNAPLLRYSIGYWHINLVLDDIEHFILFGGGSSSYLIWNGRIDARIYTTNSQGQFITTTTGNTSIGYSALNIRPGENKIRVVSIENWPSYNEGVLVYGRHYGLLQLYFISEGATNYVIEILGNGDSIAWDGAWGILYRVYVNRHDGQGFVYAITTESWHNRIVPISELSLARGSNTVRVVSTQNTWNFSDGILRYGISSGEVDII